MADDPEPAGTETGADDDSYAEGEQQHQATVASLDERLDRLEQMVRDAFGRGQAPRARPAAGARQAEAEDRRREMTEALSDLRKQEKADRQMQTMAAAVRDLKKAVSEKVPREFRRVEMLMGWPDRE